MVMSMFEKLRYKGFQEGIVADHEVIIGCNRQISRHSKSGLQRVRHQTEIMVEFLCAKVSHENRPF